MEMEYDNIIEIDVWSTFGCFTKPFSNTGGFLTYLIPPKTSIIGMIGAILGYKFDDFFELKDKRVYKIEELYDIKISIQAMFDLKVKRIVFNSHYGNDKKDMLNVKQDLLLNPKYKLYISFPEHLKKQERQFLDSLKSSETTYNLYMGRNEFPVNYELKNYLKNVDSLILDSSSLKKFFEEEQQVYGILSRESVVNPQLKTQLNEPTKKKLSLFKRVNRDIRRLASHFEYLIKEYPVKRYNFTQFEYMPLSFYSMDEKRDCYFDKFDLKDNKQLILHNIGGSKWISLI